MMTCKIVLITLLIGAFWTPPVHPDSGDWWCPGSWGGMSGEKIDVWIHPDLPKMLWHADGTPWTPVETQREVRYVLEMFKNGAPTGLPPLEFAGFEPPGTAWSDPAPANSIVVRPNLHCGDEMVPSGSGRRVEFAPSLFCPHRREHWRYCGAFACPSPGDTWGGVLAHEIQHALGFHHWNVCQTTPPNCQDNPSPEPQICGLMQAHGLDSEYYELEYSDWSALSSIYGDWEYDGIRRRESSNANNWTTLSNGPFTGPPQVRSDWSQGSTLMPIGTYNTAGDPWLMRWSRSADTFTDWGTPYTFGRQLGPVDVAVSFGKRYLGFLYGQRETDTQKLVRYSSHTGASASTVVYTPHYASRHGHAISYDVKSNRLLHVWRNAENHIMLSHSDGVGVPETPIALTGAAYRAVSAPSLSCGPASIDYNCILVWASTGELGHHHTLRWIQFRRDTSRPSGFAFGTAYDTGYIQFGPPTVTYAGPATSNHAFVVAFKNPGRCYFTLRKRAGPDDAFGVERQHCSPLGSYNGPPMIGATNPNWIEAWVQYHDANE